MSFITRHRWLTASGLILVGLVLALLLFQWDWLIPIVNKQASAALGRPVTVTHLHVHLGRNTRIEADVIVGLPQSPTTMRTSPVDREGEVSVIDSNNHRVQRFRM